MCYFFVIILLLTLFLQKKKKNEQNEDFRTQSACAYWIQMNGHGLLSTDTNLGRNAGFCILFCCYSRHFSSLFIFNFFLIFFLIFLIGLSSKFPPPPISLPSPSPFLLTSPFSPLLPLRMKEKYLQLKWKKRKRRRERRKERRRERRRGIRWG